MKRHTYPFSPPDDDEKNASVGWIVSRWDG